MRTVVFFTSVIATFLFYLWERAYSFDQCQQLARLQEQRQRMVEVCDSLKACAANARSDFRIASLAGRLGLEPKYALVNLAVPVAVAQSAEHAKKLASGKSAKPGMIAGKNARARVRKSPSAHSGPLTSLTPGQKSAGGGEM